MLLAIKNGFLSTKEHKNYLYVIIKRFKLKDRIVAVKWNYEVRNQRKS